MIPIVEDYLSELLQGTFDALKADPSILSKVLSSSQVNISKLSQYLQDNSIKVIKGYPRTPAELPCVCILLSSEQESQEGLGDYGDFEDISTLGDSGTFVASLGNAEGLTTLSVQMPNKPLVDVQNIVHVETGMTLDQGEYYVYNYDLGLVSILSPLVEDGDHLVVDYTYADHAVASTQTLYETNYRIESWSTNGDITVAIYHLAKYCLLSKRETLLGKGLFNQKLGGGDFDPAPNYFPEFVYRRGLSFWSQLTVGVPGEIETFIQGTSITQDEIVIDGGG